jgi:hypothetical protein
MKRDLAGEWTAKYLLHDNYLRQQTGRPKKRKMMKAGALAWSKKISLLTGLPNGGSRTV